MVDRTPVNEDLRRGAAIDVHLFVALALRLDVEHDWWKRARNGGRRKHDLADGVDRFRLTRRSDLRDVPDDRAARIEISRPDKKQLPLCVLCRDRIHHLLGYVDLQQLRERRRLRQCILQEHRIEEPLGRNVFLRHARVHRHEGLVVVWAQESERGDQRAGAHARYQLELWPRPRLGPAI